MRMQEGRSLRSYLNEVDFETIKQRFDAFWNREVIDRPLIYITAPRKPERSITLPEVKTIEEKWTNIDYVLKKAELYFESTVFLGDALPHYCPNLGPNQLTAFLGGELIFLDEHTSWVKPFLNTLEGFEPYLNKSNKWWRRIDEIMDAVCKVAEGNFLVGIPDLHYGGDALAAMIGTRNLVRALYTHPKEVKRIISRLTEICIEVFEAFYQKISRIQSGSISWIPAYSRGKFLPLQDDFSGLVSPKTFREFFLEEQIILSKHLDNSIFHLDGPMALGNLDALLEVDSIDGIQWVPGAGSPPASKWIHICQKILDSGKCLYISCEPWEVKIMLEKLKHGGLFLQTWCRDEDEAYRVLKIVEKYGAR
ncbi:MAG: uroporphyrinogen decarboxylase family protein [Candidatus Bathyarchaeota archaeon]|nr:uroporphyrinogen decarboxylase family protein [Candidatus Bathyarchaeota archaeon]